MTNYRRNRLEGGTYFFTLAIAERNLDLLVRHIQILKTAFKAEHQRAPFVNIALVILPDHLHAMWRLPRDDTDFSSRWRRIKAAFSKALPSRGNVSKSRELKGERGIWQRRFWEHTIQDEKDFLDHLDYIHFNPAKHGLVPRVSDWPHSTFHEYVQRGVYAPDWGGCNELLNRGFGE